MREPCPICNQMVEWIKHFDISNCYIPRCDCCCVRKFVGVEE